MNPSRLKLVGFKGIKAGLGRDELELDLEKLGGELIAIVGPNGTGKTTILDNLQPYRLLPSRATSYSPAAFSMAEHVEGKAMKELVWEHDGEIYRSTLVIKADLKTPKTEAYLHVWMAEAWHAVTILDGTVSDGKTSTYDRCVEGILGPPELFFTAAFSAQGRPALAGYGQGDVKSLMSEILDLAHLEALEKDAKAAHKAASADLHAAQLTLENLSRQRDEKAELEGRIGELQEDIERAERDLAAGDEAIEKASMELAAAEAEQAAADQRAAELGKQRDELEADLDRRRREQAAALLDLSEQAERAMADKKHALECAIVDQERAENTLRGFRREMQQAQVNVASYPHGLEERASRVDKLADELKYVETYALKLAPMAQRRRDMEARLSELRQTMSVDVEMGKSADEQRKDLLDAASLVDKVPCGGQEHLVSTCPLLEKARKSRTLAVTVSDRMDELRRKCRGTQADIKAIEADLDELPSHNAIEKARADVRACERELHEAQRARDQLVAKVAEERRVRDLTSKVSEQETVVTEMAGRTARLRDELEPLKGQWQQRIEQASRQHDEAAAQVRLKLAALPDPGAVRGEATDAVVKLAAELKDRRAARHMASNGLRSMEGQLGGLRARLEAIADVSTEDQERTVEQLSREVSEWALLAKALGRDGIVALSIDDAGPAIAGLANDLLMDCFGPRFTVAIRTQAETRSGDVRESFEIAVFDSETGDEKPFRALSGGQKVYVNECLTRAIALFQAARGGRRYGCLFADESDGALDGEKKVEFERMKRAVLERGGYRREFFISHTEALWGLADSVINTGDLRLA